MERLFDHLDLRVHDLVAADAFYRELCPALGFPDRTSGPDWICYDAGDPHAKSRFIALIEDRQHRPNATRIAFWKERREAIDALAPLLHRLCARKLEGPVVCPEYSPEYYAAFFEDPSGNRLEICCRQGDPAAPQEHEREKELWDLERRFWLGGEEVYAKHLDAAAVMVFAGIGILRAPEIVSTLKQAPRWESLHLTNQTLSRTGSLAVLAYEAEANRASSPVYKAWCSSTYRSDGDALRLIQHQQTPRS